MAQDWHQLGVGWRAAQLLVCDVALAGCGGNDGPQRIEVHGKVDLNGKPLDVASISFLPTGENKGPSANTAIKQGEYHFTKEDGPVAGSHQVVIMLLPSKAGPAKTPNVAGGAPAKSSWDFNETIPEKGPYQKDFNLK